MNGFRLHGVRLLATIGAITASLLIAGGGTMLVGAQSTPATGTPGVGAGGGDVAGELGTLRLVIGDVQGLAGLQREYGAFRDELQRALGVKVEFYAVPNLAAALAAMEAQRADLVLAGPAEYVSMRARANAEPVVGLSRPDYYSVIAVQADSGIGDLADLRGQEIVMEQPLGTSTHLGPCKILQDAGLNCQSDVELTLLQERGTATNTFAANRVPAIGTNADRYATMLEASGLSTEEAPIIATGPQLPPDVFMMRPGVSAETRQRIQAAMIENEDALIGAILAGGEENSKFEGSRFIEVADSDFDYIREAYRAVGIDDFAELIDE